MEILANFQKVFSGKGATSTAVGSFTTVKFNTIFDPLNQYNASTGEWNVPEKGLYFAVSQTWIQAASSTVNQFHSNFIQVNGTSKVQFTKYVSNIAIQNFPAQTQMFEQLVSNDKIKLIADTNITTPSLAVNDYLVYLHVFKVI